MRSILYSPGYGAGWTTWGGDTPEQKRFMLEYKPFIDYVRGGGKFETHYFDDAIEQHPLVIQFKAEWKRRWPEAIKVDNDGKEYGYPYFGGLRDLEVMDVPDGARVRIDEYDGSESVEVEGATSDVWL